MIHSRSRTPRVSCTAVNTRWWLAPACVMFALVCSAGSSQARETPVPTPQMTAQGEVHAGQMVEIRWDALPPGVPEMELLLSVDGGRHYPIRLTAEMSGRETRFLWKVPNLGVQQAHIRLRANVNGID